MGMMGIDATQFEALAARQQSVNDLVRGQMTTLLGRPELSAADKQRLDLHFSSIRDLENSLSCNFTAEQQAVIDGMSPGYESDDGEDYHQMKGDSKKYLSYSPGDAGGFRGRQMGKIPGSNDTMGVGAGGGVPQSHRPVVAGRGKLRAVRAEGQVAHCVGMSGERLAELNSRRRIPDPDRTVPPTRGQHLSVWAEGDGVHFC